MFNLVFSTSQNSVVQLDHSHFSKTPQSSEIIIICQKLLSPANVGALFRLSDAFGVKEIIFEDTIPDLSSSRLRKTARNTEKTVCYRASKQLSSTVKQLQDEGYISIALEITSNSVAIDQLKRYPKYMLILGNERHGIDKEILENAHYQAHINMYGNNSSMNVAQATGIALYELRRV